MNIDFFFFGKQRRAFIKQNEEYKNPATGLTDTDGKKQTNRR